MAPYKTFGPVTERSLRMQSGEGRSLLLRRTKRQITAIASCGIA